MRDISAIKFLNSYTKDDIDVFFGRYDETKKFYNKVKKSKIVLLYGISGTGKTSLIQCGLENKYEEEQRRFIYVRKGRNISQSLMNAISVEADSLINPKDKPIAALNTLYYDYLKPITLVFDQFEELFISGTFEESQELFEVIVDILRTNIKVKIIISLREEYLAFMDEFESYREEQDDKDWIPSVFDFRYRLEKMRHRELKDVIIQITENTGFSIEDDTIPGNIIENISNKKQNVDLPYLQVYLLKLTKLAETRSDEKFTLDLVKEAGRLEDVLEDFLEDQVDEITKVKDSGSKEYVEAVLKAMITFEGTKKQLTKDQLQSAINLNTGNLDNILLLLQDRRLVKLEDGVYELAHDSLAEKVDKKRSTEERRLNESLKSIKNKIRDFPQDGTLLSRKRLKLIKEDIPKLDLSEKEKLFVDQSKSRVKRNNIIFISIVLVFIAAIFFAVNWWAGFQQQEKFENHLNVADNFMKIGYEQEDIPFFINASEEYEKALDIFPDNKQVADEIKNCDTIIKLLPEIKTDIAVGDTHFNRGIKMYSSAFVKYNSAEKQINSHAVLKKFNKIKSHINNKKEDAFTDLMILAEKESALLNYEHVKTLINLAYSLNYNNTKIITDLEIMADKMDNVPIANYYQNMIDSLSSLNNTTQ